MVLDLDETLICHREVEDGSENPKADFRISIGSRRKVQYDIYVRPGVRDFLKEASKHWELVLFTASHAEV